MWLSPSVIGFPTEAFVCITSHLHPKTSGVLSLWSPVLQMKTVGQGVREIAQSHHTRLHLILAKTQWRSRKADSKQHLLSRWAFPGPFPLAACAQAALIVEQVFPQPATHTLHKRSPRGLSKSPLVLEAPASPDGLEPYSDTINCSALNFIFWRQISNGSLWLGKALWLLIWRAENPALILALKDQAWKIFAFKFRS